MDKPDEVADIQEIAGIVAAELDDYLAAQSVELEVPGELLLPPADLLC